MVSTQNRTPSPEVTHTICICREQEVVFEQNSRRFMDRTRRGNEAIMVHEWKECLSFHRSQGDHEESAFVPDHKGFRQESDVLHWSQTNHFFGFLETKGRRHIGQGLGFTGTSGAPDMPDFATSSGLGIAM